MSFGIPSRNGLPLGLGAVAGLSSVVPDTYVGPLNSYTAGLWSATAVNRLLTSYTGPLLRVRRSSDNAEQDIGYLESGALNTTDLALFVGSNNALVTRWYDQSGAGNDFTQTTAASQPQLVIAGVYQGVALFNNGSSGQNMVTTATGGATTAKSIFQKITNQTLSGTNRILWEYGDSGLIGTASGNGQMHWNEPNSPSGPSGLINGNSSSAFYGAQFDVAYRANAAARGTVIDRTRYPANNPFRLWFGGAERTPSAIGPSGSPSFAGNFPSWAWRVGCRSGGLLSANIGVWSTVIYDADKSADALAINAALA